MIIEFSKENPIVLGEKPVLLDFYATWCGPCKVTGNNLEKFIESHPEITIYKINVEEQEETVNTWKVQNLPTLIYTNFDGELWRHNGLMTLKQLEDKLL